MVKLIILICTIDGAECVVKETPMPNMVMCEHFAAIVIEYPGATIETSCVTDS